VRTNSANALTPTGISFPEAPYWLMFVMSARRRARSPPWHRCPSQRCRFLPIFPLRALRRVGLNPCAAVHGAYHLVDDCTHHYLALCGERQVVMLPGAPRRHRALSLLEFHLCEPNCTENCTEETANGRAAAKLCFQSHVKGWLKGVCRLKQTCTPTGDDPKYVTTLPDVHI